jgi:hypothetical protein
LYSTVFRNSLSFYGRNGGAFGGGHNDAHPLVAFFCRKEIFPFIDAAAQRSGAGLGYNHARWVTVFGRDVDTFIVMASSLYDLWSEIDAVRVLPAKIGPRPPDAQRNLF